MKSLKKKSLKKKKTTTMKNKITKKQIGSSDKCTKQKLDKFIQLFDTYINQIFGDRIVRSYIYKVYGNKNHNKHLRFGLIDFQRHEDQDKIWEESNENDSVPRSEAQFHLVEEKDDQIATKDSIHNHHVLYDYKNKKYLDSINTEGYRYQNQERDKEDTLCQSYSLMFFFNFRLDNDPIQKQMQIIEMYEWLIEQPKFLDELNEWMFHVEKNKHQPWTHANGTVISTQGAKSLTNLIKKIKNTLTIWQNYGYRCFIGDGTCDSHLKYNIEDYDSI
jgi:hypothetical protein